MDNGSIIQNIVWATAFKGSRGNVDCSEVVGIQSHETVDESINGTRHQEASGKTARILQQSNLVRLLIRDHGNDGR